MNRTEKILGILVIWPFIGTLFGFTAAILIGGRAGSSIIGIGLLLGIISGGARSAYVYSTYSNEHTLLKADKKKLILKRIFVGLLYLLLIYTVIISVFFD